MNVLVFLAVVGALVLLSAAGLRLPVGQRGWPRWLERALVLLVAGVAVVLANVALYTHDVHFDLTESGAFTPSPDAQRLARGLREDVDVTYFYQKQDPQAVATRTMLEIMGRMNPKLHVRTVDPDQYPGMASRYGVRAYNVAVLECGGRRVQVQSSSDREIALGIVRVARTTPRTVCFATGHGEYDIDNFEFHTHFEGAGGHAHNAEGTAVVQMQQHGFGRVRRALESLGYATRKVILATEGRVDPACSVLVDAGPRTRSTPNETAALEAFLSAGGAALLLYDLDTPVDPALAALLGAVGVRLEEGVVVDPIDHYFTDEQMVAVSQYGAHAVTGGLALSFYPGSRPTAIGAAPPGVTVTPLVSSSKESYVRPVHAVRDEGARYPRGPSVIAAAVEGGWPARPAAAPFRLILVGDVDWASNSFFPYMSNADLLISAVAWLAREERGATMKPAQEVLPQVVLTARQVNGIFALTVFVMPGLAFSLGGFLWWRRRR